MADLVIRAAGVVLLRPSSRGAKVLVVHRPSHKDWSLPKGKLDKGEHVLTAAARECDEETGIVPLLGPSLGRQRYQVMGRPKTVDYWVATPGRNNGFTPDNEIDEIRWVTPDQARSLLSYTRDVELVQRAVALPRTTPFIILRHAVAMKRSDFSGKDDQARPLTGKGRSQAKQLVPILQAFGIDAVHSSDAARCMQTVQPFATAARVTVDQEPQLSEVGFEDKPKGVGARIRTLAGLPNRICVCSHRPVLPALLAPLSEAAGKGAGAAFRGTLEPGSMVVAHRTIGKDGWDVVAAERHDL